MDSAEMAPDALESQSALASQGILPFTVLLDQLLRLSPTFRTMSLFLGNFHCAVVSCFIVPWCSPNQTFASDPATVHYILGLLRGRALAWTEAVNVNIPIMTLFLLQFKAMLQQVIDHPDHCGDTSQRVLNSSKELQQ